MDGVIWCWRGDGGLGSCGTVVGAQVVTLASFAGFMTSFVD